MSEDLSITARVRALRDRAGLSRAAIGDLIGDMPGTTFQTYETTFKKPFLPLDLALKLKSALVGRGDPPITADEVLALAGLTSTPLGQEGPADVKPAVAISYTDPQPGDPINDRDEAALLRMWRKLSVTKQAALFARLGDEEMPSLRKSA